MSLEKISRDRWRSSPPTFTTSLKVSEHESDDMTNLSLTSDLCGFGWRYQVELAYKRRNKRTAVRHMTIFLDPFLLCCASVGKMKLVTRYRKVASSDWTTCESLHITNMPNEGTSIAFFDLGTLSFLPGIIIEVTLHLQNAFSLLDFVGNPRSNLPPSKLPIADIVEAVRNTLDGEELVDTRLDLFTSLSMDKRLGGPKSLFVSSRLLLGRCETLDSCECSCTIKLLLCSHLTSTRKSVTSASRI
jgi:hypothetical protein